MQFKHLTKKGRVTVKHPIKDVTLDNIKAWKNNPV